jgi:serine/threonine-protein kinase
VPPLQQPYRHPSAPPGTQQPAPTKDSDGSGGRQVLIVLAVVLALLVLLCAGVISFLLKQGGGSSSLGELRPYATGAHGGTATETLSTASYRLIQQVGGPRGLDHASEGLQTL